MNDFRTWNPEFITTILSKSADIALRHYNAPSTSIKSDMSLVTEADHEIEAYLVSMLDDPDTGTFIIGEETIQSRTEDYIDRAFSGVAYIVDPIDGTAPYAHHIPTWGISIGRMENYTLTDGAIYLPVTDELFITRNESVEYGHINSNRTVITTPENRLEFAEKKTSGMIALTQGIAKGRGIDVPNPVQAMGCAVLPLAYLLLDRYIGYIGKVKLWDCAGALPMLERAGFVSTFTDGTPVGTAVNDRLYTLAPGNRDQWKLRKRLVCASTNNIADYITGSIIRG